MALKYFRYETDLGDKFGATIDAELHAALVLTGAWSGINRAGVNGTVYDDFAALDAADATLSAMLPSTMQPRIATISVLGQQITIPLPAPPAASSDGNLDSLQSDITFTPVRGIYQGEQDFDLTD